MATLLESGSVEGFSLFKMSFFLQTAAGVLAQMEFLDWEKTRVKNKNWWILIIFTFTQNPKISFV